MNFYKNMTTVKKRDNSYLSHLKKRSVILIVDV